MSNPAIATQPISTPGAEGTNVETPASRSGWSEALVQGPQATEGGSAASEASHPWMKFAGMFPRSDPRVREWLEIIEERRRSGDGELLPE